jgi:hypothetical protein
VENALGVSFFSFTLSRQTFLSDQSVELKKMLTDITLAYLSTLTYHVDAKQGVCVLPLASIHWDDEMPDLSQVPEEDHDQIFLLFAIRSKLWDEVRLSLDEERLWKQVRSRAPEWALFQRLRLSPDEREAREAIERDCAQALDELFSTADHITISRDQHGYEKRSATFLLNKEQKPAKRKSLWKGITRRVKVWIRSRNL